MIKKIKDYSLIALGILALGIIALVLLKYLLPVLSPFIIAWLIATVTRSPAERLSRKIGVPERVLRLMMSLFLTGIIFGGIALIIWRMTAAVWHFLSGFGEGNRLYEFILSLTSPEPSILGNAIPLELRERISNAINQMLSSALTSLGAAVTSWVGAVPSILFFLLVTVIALVYLSLDLERINAFLSSLLPERALKKIEDMRDGAFSAVKKYLRSYILIVGITFAIMLIGFISLGVSNAPLVALVVSLLDILPVIGVGTVLVPWGIFEIATGNHFLGIGLLVLFVVNTVVRQFSEPKIVGKSLNLHPVATLIMLYAGYALFGLAGLLLVPVISIVVAAVLKKNHSAHVA